MVKPLHAEDPYELKGVMLDGGNPMIQARITIEEFLVIGISPQSLIRMFGDRFYGGLYLLTEQLGPEVISELITIAAEKMGGSRRVTTAVTDQE